MFREQPSEMFVELNEPVELVCIACGIPEVEYLWFRWIGGMSLPIELDARVMEVNGTLNIAMATREDAGQYICVALNEHGNVTSDTARLSVAGKLPIVQ